MSAMIRTFLILDIGFWNLDFVIDSPPGRLCPIQAFHITPLPDDRRRKTDNRTQMTEINPNADCELVIASVHCVPKALRHKPWAFYLSSCALNLIPYTFYQTPCSYFLSSIQYPVSSIQHPASRLQIAECGFRIVKNRSGQSTQLP